jgi:CDP-paratose 2-epimerase
MKDFENKRIFITGGAGFIGTNIAKYFLDRGAEIIVFDNLSRKNVEKNIKWLQTMKNKNFKFLKEDIRNFAVLAKSFKEIEPDVVLHCCAQTAVTTSVKNPREDFDINALGTLNVLESARQCTSSPVIIYTSTNKVYGNNVNKIPLIEKESRYEFSDKKFKNGIPEDFPTDAAEHTPYGCSKYVADLYVRDYFSVYGLPAVIFRMSCIYGTRQFGIEDQGWVAHFIISSILNRQLTVYGDGKQVRDILFVDDLVKAVELVIDKISSVKGQVFNIGGGSENTISLLELINVLEKISKRKISYNFSEWRPFDQRVYVSDICKINKYTGWKPKIDISEGIEKLFKWVDENKRLFK